MQFQPTTVARFWAKVEKFDTCWLWRGALCKGYGQMTVNYRRMYAHRFAWELLVGPIPAGRQIDHLCRVTTCVNPAHMEPVTQRENLIRGEGFAGQQARRTHCPKGHPYNAANTGWNAGHRYCKACNRERMRAAYKPRPGRKAIAHCPQGHAYDVTNTYEYRGRRSCRICNRDKVRRYHERQRG